MIFIWTPDGGPLQYVGLAIFLFQFIPVFIPAASASLNLPITTMLSAATALSMTAIAYSWQTGALSRLAEYVTRGFPHVMQTVHGAIRALRQTTGISTNGGLTLLLGGTVVAFSAFFLWLDAHVISSLFHVFGVCLILRAQLRGQAGMGGNIPGAGGTEAESRAAKMDEIVKIVQKMPVEEFVPEDDAMDKFSISQLKKMLAVRGQQTEGGSYLERQDLVDAVKKRRNFCESCVICCEEYNEGEPLRILPRCSHEFHLECLDQWAYTFANKSKRRRQPSCPLCNASLK